MKILKYTSALVLILSLFSCEKRWEEHYDTKPETVDMNVWEAIQANPDLSMFVQQVKDYKYDTLFLNNQTFTVFVPDNEAMSDFAGSETPVESMLDYHFSPHFFQSQSVNGLRLVQTLAEKFALFENTGSTLYLDNIDLSFESPLYNNGKYFILDQVAEPKPNLYEFFSVENPVLTAYIDSQDSIVIDKELSRPIGFDEFGNTVYDTVSEIYNEFEEMYFPVSKESRSKTATIVFPREEDYNDALTDMASFLGDIYQSHEDIPLDWQYDVLVPYLLDHGVFENMIEPEEFIPPPYPDTLKMKNILGDSIYVEYTPIDKTICSNGYTYNYENFMVPDTLYKSPQRTEGESLLEQVGINAFAWDEEVLVNSTKSFEPLREFSGSASNDSLVRVPFDRGYTGTYDLEFNVKTLFPGKYLMIVRTHMYVGGIYDIYLNDELVLTIDYYDYALNWELWFSANGQEIYKPEGPYNRFDCFVDKQNEYGNTKVKFVYREPGNVQNNGLVIDYIDFVPYED